jgi:hypothetical protein
MSSASTSSSYPAAFANVVKLKVHTSDEIEVLADAFNSMAET